jgi:hypothetical protein
MLVPDGLTHAVFTKCGVRNDRVRRGGLLSLQNNSGFVVPK